MLSLFFYIILRKVGFSQNTLFSNKFYKITFCKSKNRFPLLMKHLIYFFFSLFVFTSCRKEFASFQKSANLDYSSKKNSDKSEILITPTKHTLTASVENLPVIADKTEIFSSQIIDNEAEKILLNDGRKRKKRKNVSKKESTFIEKIFPNKAHNDKKVVKKRKKPVPINSTIYAGFIILGIAILLALLSLSSLSLLFGVAAILFLFIGFKTYFRKKRRRNIFR